MEEEYQKGNIVIKKDGRLERRKYQRDFRGKQVGNLWTDISLPLGDERVGYPTQKRLALLSRIIEASSNEGDLVLDPFCGCATTMVQAERLGRQWVGIDLSTKAAELVISRLQKYDIPLQRSDFHISATIPIRTDVERELAQTQSERLQLKDELYADQAGLCNLCHTWFEPRNFELDHIVPRAKGGLDWIDNFQLLCSACNKIKSTGTQEQARARLAASRGIDLSVFEKSVK